MFKRFITGAQAAAVVCLCMVTVSPQAVACGQAAGRSEKDASPPAAEEGVPWGICHKQEKEQAKCN